MLLDPGAATAQQLCAADVNDDGAANGDDIAAFADCIIAGICP